MQTKRFRLKVAFGVIILMIVVAMAGRNLLKFRGGGIGRNEADTQSGLETWPHRTLLLRPTRYNINSNSEWRPKTAQKVVPSLQHSEQEHALRENDRIHESGVHYAKSVTHAVNLLSDATLSGETDTVLTRMNICLESTNMSDYFKKKGYYATAQMNVRLVFQGLRKIIPRFGMSYTVPCWNTTFQATKESLRTSLIKRRILNRNASSTISGSVGGFHFSYGDSNLLLPHVRDVLSGSHWTRKGRDLYIERSVACLPKIFLLGYPKCGSTFLYCLIRKVLRLTHQIEGVCEVTKEPHWWVYPGPRDTVQSHLPDYVAHYLLNFNRGAEYVERSLPAVTIDASPNLMFQWPRYSESESMENYCLIPSLVPVLLPDSRYFVVMRNPVSMLYSAFWFSCTMGDRKMKSSKYKGPDIFHERITRKIGIFNNCTAQGEPLDKCMDAVAYNIYTSEFHMCGRSRLEMGLYFIHARKWLSVVPRERIHFFTLEELATVDLKHTAKVILDFLEIPMTHDSYNFHDMNCNENQQKIFDYKHDPRLQMREDTKQILERFFQPYNQMLANLLGDDKFLWSGGH